MIAVADLVVPPGQTLPVPRVVARFEYEPYGRVIRSEMPEGASALPPPLSVGHHGLIALDADTNLADLNHGPTSWSVGPLDANVQNLLYLTPNRVLNPRLGRWLQADPIASGLPVHASIALGGRPAVAGASVGEFNLQNRFADGVNLYQYARGNPVTGGDPTGLWWDEVQDGLHEVWDRKGQIFSYAQKPDLVTAGVAGLRGAVDELVGQYAANQESDLDWATDWSQGDNWHSRGSDKWVGFALALGASRGFLENFHQATADFADVMEGGGGIAQVGTFAGVGQGIKSGVEATGQWHHAISKKVHDALERHPRLKGLYRYRDNRFLTRAVDGSAHRGYQKWHREYDNTLAKWIEDRQGLSPATFERHLRSLYARGDLAKRFPNGL